jgi:hypothetical protein
VRSSSRSEFVEQVNEEPIHADAAGHFDPVWNEPAEEVPEQTSKTVEPTDWALEELRQFSEASRAAGQRCCARLRRRHLRHRASRPSRQRHPSL